MHLQIDQSFVFISAFANFCFCFTILIGCNIPLRRSINIFFGGESGLAGHVAAGWRACDALYAGRPSNVSLIEHRSVLIINVVWTKACHVSEHYLNSINESCLPVHSITKSIMLYSAVVFYGLAILLTFFNLLYACLFGVNAFFRVDWK